MMLPATFQNDGLYIAKQSITEPGSYFVYYHVSARDFHTMKKIPFTVTATKEPSASASSQDSPVETIAGSQHEQSGTHDHGTTRH
jgi:hypothetical protein